MGMRKKWSPEEKLSVVNDEKSGAASMQQRDDIFAYYINERGTLKCDWIEIGSRYDSTAYFY